MWIWIVTWPDFPAIPLSIFYIDNIISWQPAAASIHGILKWSPFFITADAQYHSRDCKGWETFSLFRPETLRLVDASGFIWFRDVSEISPFARPQLDVSFVALTVLKSDSWLFPQWTCSSKRSTHRVVFTGTTSSVERSKQNSLQLNLDVLTAETSSVIAHLLNSNINLSAHNLYGTGSFIELKAARCGGASLSSRRVLTLIKNWGYVEIFTSSSCFLFLSFQKQGFVWN